MTIRSARTVYCRFPGCEKTQPLTVYNPECSRHGATYKAAPEMLAMLKRAYEWDNFNPFGAELKALIAKAEGLPTDA